MLSFRSSLNQRIAVDFFNEVSLIWGLICDVITGEPQAQIGEAFPPGFEYRWAEGGKEAVRVSGPQYVSKVLTWVEAELNNTTTFPTIEGKMNYFPFIQYDTIQQTF